MKLSRYFENEDATISVGMTFTNTYDFSTYSLQMLEGDVVLVNKETYELDHPIYVADNAKITRKEAVEIFEFFNNWRI